MENSFQKLYTQFLKGEIKSGKFEELKNSINRLSDEELFRHMEDYWLNHNDYPKLNSERKQRIREKLYKQIIYRKKLSSTFWTRMATAVAIVAFCIVSSLHFIQSNKPYTPDIFQAIASGNSKVQLTLPDKSSVKLNSESSLSYYFEKGKRITKLNGEGYFQVTRDEKHPFIVQVGDLNIEVLGTSFNIYSYSDSDVIETSLIEGSIRLFDSKNPTETYMLRPSQKAIYSRNDRKIRFQDTDNIKETAWLQNHLVFESERLSTVFHRIERWYGVKITLMCPEIANDLISGSFKDEQLPYVMEALKIQYGFNYELTGNNVIITKVNLK
ncbi:FecR family protein [Massilibacteroides vaginae]|uniref:FecR family protein n=1 Tax=Massilibacteroides vaginae TaxID=1673718 RepID=UPI000A1C9B74|nr:FecR domain-containing protein [Massilibacteroides vaginae]